MAIIRAYRGVSPTLGNRVFLAETAAIVGDVILGDDVSVWYSSVVRGDCHFIRVGARSNIQDCSVLHVTAGTHPCILEEEVTVGHGAVVHGCTVRRGALIGIGAQILDAADIGEEAFIAAGALVTPGTKVPPRTMWWGSPARQRRELSAAEVADLGHYHRNYLGYSEEYRRADAEAPGRQDSAVAALGI